MSVTEAPRSVFGQITLADMRGNELLTKAVLPVIAAASKRAKGRISVDKVADGVISGEYDLWGVMVPPATLKAVAVCRKTPGVYEILLVGPHIEDMARYMPILERAAKGLGCERLALAGPGFFRQHLPPGWFEREIRFEKLVANEPV